VRKPLPEKLGGKLWFFLLMIAIGCSGVIHGALKGVGLNIIGGVMVIAIYVAQTIQLVRDVRLARYLKQHPDIAKTYYAGY
jgi:hypothetical protein